MMFYFSRSGNGAYSLVHEKLKHIQPITNLPNRNDPTFDATQTCMKAVITEKGI
jgi:hypothetical protein